MQGKNSHKKNKAAIQSLATGMSFFLFLYFLYHLMHGDQGYFALKGAEEKLHVSKARYEYVAHQREALERRVKMLRPGSIDPDLLDERARAVLGFVRASEIVILDTKG